MISLLLDQGLPASAARDLRASGWDVVHVSELGLAAAPDTVILRTASSEDRVVVTLDADFPMLLALERRARPSVIHLRDPHVDLKTCCRLVEQVVGLVQADLQAGCVVSVRADDVRVRRLPIGD